MTAHTSEAVIARIREYLRALANIACLEAQRDGNFKALSIEPHHGVVAGPTMTGKIINPLESKHLGITCNRLHVVSQISSHPRAQGTRAE